MRRRDSGRRSRPFRGEQIEAASVVMSLMVGTKENCD